MMTASLSTLVISCFLLGTVTQLAKDKTIDGSHLRPKEMMAVQEDGAASLHTAGVGCSAASTTSTAAVVSVRFYGESQCPYCRRFVTDAWQTVWLDEGLRSSIEYDFVAWGNAYWRTTACGSNAAGRYSADERACWYKQCIDKAFKTNDVVEEDEDDDCFSGDPVYQHSTKEGIVDIYETCVKLEYGVENAVAFTYCAEGSIMDNEDLDAESIMRVCTVSLSPNVDSDKVQDCYRTRGRELEIANAKQTPSHPGVPWVLVDGKAIDDPLSVKEAICTSLKSKGATLPESCTAVLAATMIGEPSS